MVLELVQRLVLPNETTDGDVASPEWTKRARTLLAEARLPGHLENVVKLLALLYANGMPEREIKAIVSNKSDGLFELEGYLSRVRQYVATGAIRAVKLRETDPDSKSAQKTGA